MQCPDTSRITYLNRRWWQGKVHPSGFGFRDDLYGDNLRSQPSQGFCAHRVAWEGKISWTYEPVVWLMAFQCLENAERLQSSIL